MKLIAYKTYDYKAQSLVPAARTRDWMDKTPGSFAYHCLPMVMANSLGWFLINHVPFEVEWDGNEPTGGLKVWPTEELTESEKRFLPVSHFGSGILTFHAEFMFWTEENICILAKGPANYPKHGIQALEGIVETEWLPYPFTMNWKMTQKEVRVRFDRNEPIAQIIPFPLNLIEAMEPEILTLQTNPELYHRYEDYKAKRYTFNDRAEEIGYKRRQKYYVRGEDSKGNEHQGAHLTDWRVKPFANHYTHPPAPDSPI